MKTSINTPALVTLSLLLSAIAIGCDGPKSAKSSFPIPAERTDAWKIVDHKSGNVSKSELVALAPKVNEDTTADSRLLHSSNVVSQNVVQATHNTTNVATVDENIDFRVKGVVVPVKDIEIPAQQNGQLTALVIHEGDVVEVDQIVASLNRKQSQLSYDASKAQVSIAKMQAQSDVEIRNAEMAVVYAARALKRGQEANIGTPAFSPEEMDGREHEHQRALLGTTQAKQEQLVRQQEHQLKVVEMKIALLQLAQRDVKSPIHGMVVEIFKKQGEWVQAGESLASVVRLDRVRVSARINALDVSTDLIGRPVRFTPDPELTKNQTTYTGKLVFISPEIDPTNRTIKVFAEIENPVPMLRKFTSGTLSIMSKAVATED